MHVKRPKAYAREQHTIGALKATMLPRLAGAGELAFGDWLVSDITTDTVERFRELRSRRRTVRYAGEQVDRQVGGIVTANRNLSFLRGVFNWAIRIGLVERTPFKRGTETVVKLTHELKRTRRLEAGEAERLLDACSQSQNPALRATVEAAIETGCRLGELLSLQWHQIRSTPKPHLFLPAQKTKTKKDRRIPISTRLQAILDMRRTDPNGEDQPATAYVFGNAIGQKNGSIKTAWDRACQRADITDLHFHDLRREAGSRWLDGGVPLQTVRDWLGHSNVSQTSTYLASTSEGEFEAMRRFEAFQKEIAFPCIGGRDNAPRTAANGTDAGQETPINIEENRSDNDPGLPVAQEVAGSIPVAHPIPH
jgi:integrase